MKKRITTILFSILFLSNFTNAETKEGLYIGGTVFGLFFNDLNNPPDNTIGFGAHIGYQITPSIGAEILYKRIETEEGSKDITTQWYGGQLNYFFFTKQAWNPYISIGISHRDVDTKYDEASDNWADIGVGIQTSINENLNFRLYGKVYYELSEISSGEDKHYFPEVGVAVNYQF